MNRFLGPLVSILTAGAFASAALAAEMTKASGDSAAAADSAARASLQTVTDYSGYQSLLNDYLVVISKKGEPLDTRFDYEKLYDARGRRARMVKTLDQLVAVPPSRMDEKARLAWAINTYNFIVIDVVTEHLLVPGRKRLRHKSVEDIRLLSTTLFQAPLLTIEGKKYSLEDFERTFVFGGYRPVLGTPTPAGLDARPHFALVRGAIGSPPLQPRAFKADSLDLQLDRAVKNALRLPRHLGFNAELGLVEGSEIFNLYAGDFGWHERSLEFVNRYAPAAIQAEIKKRKLTRIGGFLPWDWLLNQAEKRPGNTSS